MAENTPLTLYADGYREEGYHMVDLRWEGSSGGEVEVFCDDKLVAVVEGENRFTHYTGVRGGGVTWTYFVRERVSGMASASVDVHF